MNPVFFFYPTDNGAARFFVNRLDNGTAACRTFDLTEEETEMVNDLPSFSCGEELLKIFKTNL